LEFGHEKSGIFYLERIAVLPSPEKQQETSGPAGVTPSKGEFHDYIGILGSNLRLAWVLGTINGRPLPQPDEADEWACLK
jgi:hypothetical protein